MTIPDKWFSNPARPEKPEGSVPPEEPGEIAGREGEDGDDERADQADAVTGASPGTAQACSDLGLNSLEANLAKFNIKPPGVS